MPVITVVKSLSYTKWRIALYAVLFVVSALLLVPLGFTGVVYAVIMGLAGGYWLLRVVRGFRRHIDDAAWARQLFHAAINLLLLYCLLIALGPLLP